MGRRQSPSRAVHTSLRKDSVTLAGLVAQSIGTNGPELNAAATTAVVFIFAGSAAPLVYLLALVPGLFYGRTIGRFLKSIVSAGGTYVVVRAGLGDRIGLFGGATYFIGIFLFIGGTAALAAYIISQIGKALFPDQSWFSNGHWFEVAALIVVVCGYLSWRGVTVSVRLLLCLSSIGMLTIFVLDVAIFASADNATFHVSSLLPWNAGNTFTGFATALGLAMGGFGGSEASAFLAEEANAPRKLVPRSINLSIIILMVFLCINALAITDGIPAGRLGEVGNQGAAILRTLGSEYIANWYGILALAVVATGSITSVLGCVNVCVRLLYDWGREGTSPSFFGRTHLKTLTPHNAVIAVTLASVAVCIAGLIWQGDGLSAGSVVFGWVLLVGVVLVLMTYMLIGISAIVLSFRHGGASWLVYIAPIVVAFAMALAIFSQLYPFPPPPFSSAPVGAVLLSLLSAVFALVAARYRRSGLHSAEELATTELGDL